MAYAVMSKREFMLTQIKSDSEVSPQVFDYLCSLAEEWGVSVLTIAWLGFKPYPMQGALYAMLRNKCEKEGLVVTDIRVKPISRPEGSAIRAGSECEIALFDQRAFDAALAKAKDLPPVDSLKELKAMFTHTYREEGWASKESVKMTTLHNPDYIIHMAQTRAVDRCLRIIVRCPFTAASELPEGEPGFIKDGFVGDIPSGKPGEKPTIAKPGKEVVKPKAEPQKTQERKIPDKPIKPIEEDPKKKKITDVQADSALVRWSDYCRDNAPGLSKKDVDEKLAKLLRALFQKERVQDLTVAELEEWFGLMDRREIELSSNGEIKS